MKLTFASNRSKTNRMMSCVVGNETSSSSSSVSSTAATGVEPLSTFNTGAHDVSAAQPVKPPFIAAGDWNVTGGFKFGALKSQPPLDTTLSANQPTQSSDGDAGTATAVACSVVSMQSAAVSAADVMSVMPTVSQLSSTVHSTTALRSPVTATATSVSSLWSSTLMPNSKQPRDNDAAMTSLVSSATATADTATRLVNASVTSNHSEAVPVSRSAAGLFVSESESRKSLEFSSKLLSSSFVTSSSAVVSSCTLLTSHTAPLAQASSLFAFGQTAFAQNSSKPLGVPAHSALPACTGL